MGDLKSAITTLEIVIAVAAVILLGDYLGYKLGRWRLAIILACITLVAVIAFAIYAAVVLA